MPADVLTPAAAAELEPNIRMAIAGAVYFRLDAHLTPGRLMAVLRRELQRAGTKLLHDTEVRGWLVDKAHVGAVETSVGRIEADEFVLCAGVWSKQLVRDLAIKLPMQAGKGYSLTLDPAPVRPRHCAILSEARVAMTPMGRGVRFGGTLELTDIDETINPIRVSGIVKSVARYYPDVTPSHLERASILSGLRPCSPDGLPYIGRFDRFANLSAATGHAMMGVSLAPITGKLIAEVVSDEPPSLPIGALRPDRYS
jgi:D-amino-acid dehydrogenase